MMKPGRDQTTARSRTCADDYFFPNKIQSQRPDVAQPLAVKRIQLLCAPSPSLYLRQYP